MRRSHSVGSVICFCLILVTCHLEAADWSRFRGANGAGIAGSSAPTQWSATENVKWKAALPGPGFSSPIVVGDRVFVTSYSGYGISREDVGNIENLKRHVVCVSRKDGSILWSKELAAVLPEDPYAPPGVTAHGYASHTPTTDGQHVFVFLGKTGVIAYDLEGNEVWKQSVGTGSDPREWGSAASPIAHGDLVIVNAGAESRSVVGLDKKSGEVVWQIDNEELGTSWSTPVLVEGGGGPELLVATPKGVVSLDPASGDKKWNAAASDASGMATSLVIGDGVAFCIGGMQGGGSFAVRLGGSGDVTDSHVVWNGRPFASFGSPVLHDGFLYGASDSGVAYCVNADTGERVYEGRLGSEPAANAGGGRGGPQGQGQRGRGGAQAQGQRGGEGQRGAGQRGGQGGQQAQRGGQGGRGGQRGRGGRGRGGRGGGGMFGNRSYGSSVLIGENVYFTDNSGKTYIFAANPEKFELIATNSLATDDGQFNASPAVADGELFIRSNKYLYCVSE